MDPPRLRVLFVDDEAMVLQGLQRMLRPLRGEWEMGFADGGEAALRQLEASAYDVVVTDMRMPGMNGAELLREVKARHPATVRMVLSGHADRDLVSQCVGVAHQYIAKPCDPEELKTLVRNAGLLAGRVVSPEVREVIGSVERLPTPPAVYLALRQALAKEEPSVRDLAAILEQDAGMTAKVLKLVNSAFFGLRRTIVGPLEAIEYLGLETIKVLVLAKGIFDGSTVLPTRGLRLEDLWHHSMGVAAGARAIAVAEGLEPELRDECFVGGLLHDLGILVLAGSFPQRYDEAMQLVREERVLVTTAEQEFFGCTHAEVGAYLLGLWGLPSPILRIVSRHHRVYLEGEDRLTPTLVVHAADVLAGAGGGHPLFETARFNLDGLRLLGLESRLPAWQEAASGAGGA